MDDLADPVQMRVYEQRFLESDAGADRLVLAEANLSEAAKGAEMARLEFQGRFYIGDALFISVLQKV